MTPATTAPDASGRPRLSLVEGARIRVTRLDGAWWPRTRDLGSEVPGLIGVLQDKGIRINRVAYSPAGWDDRPRRLPAKGRNVRLGWFAGTDPLLVMVTGSAGERLDLLVVPPDTAQPRAAEAMAAAATAGNRLSPTAVMAAGAPSDAVAKDRSGQPSVEPAK